MPDWLLLILSTGLGGSVAALAGLLLRPCLMAHYTARWRCRLWGILAAAMILVPALLLFPVPALPTVSISLPAVQSAENSPPNSSVAPPVQDADVSTESPLVSQTQPQTANAVPPEQTSAPFPQLSLASLTACIWLAGVLLRSLWQISAQLIWHIRMRRWDMPAPSRARMAARYAAQVMRLRTPVPVRCNARVDGPLVTGFFRPVLLLPVQLPPQSELEMICMHEMAHCRRHDLWYMLLLETARSLHWYSIPLHLLVRAARQDVEMACDEAATEGKPSVWRKRYCEALLHAVPKSPGPMLTTHFAVGKRQIAARLRQIMRPGRMRKGLVVFCVSALAVTLCCCAVRIEMASSSEQESPVSEDPQSESPNTDVSLPVDLTQPEGGALDLVQITGQTDDSLEPARPGTELTEDEIFAIAQDLIRRAQLWEDWSSSPDRQKLDWNDSITRETYNESVTLYRLLDLKDRAQLEAVLESLFSAEYTASLCESTFNPDIPYALHESDGKLYANAQWGFEAKNLLQYGDSTSLQLMGAADNVISLQAVLRDETQGNTYAYPLTLRRERGRWVLHGWKSDCQTDNSFVTLPEELRAVADSNPELATKLRYAWALGDGLKRLDQQQVDWCFSGLLQPPTYWDYSYSFADLTGLQVKDFAVETRDEQVYLMLNTVDPGATPLRQGEAWYQLGFDENSAASSFGVVCQLFPDSETAAFGLGREGTNDKSQQELSQELCSTIGLYRSWCNAHPFEGGQVPENPLVYLIVRMKQDNRLPADGSITPEQVYDAALDYLDQPNFNVDMNALFDCCYEKDGRFYLKEMDGALVDLGNPCRYLGGGLATGTGTVVRRYYKDVQCLIPDYDLIYTLHRSQGGTGSWVVDSCRKVADGISYIQ